MIYNDCILKHSTTYRNAFDEELLQWTKSNYNLYDEKNTVKKLLQYFLHVLQNVAQTKLHNK